jgi:uncharacterized alkaline shock family protein YloU
MYEQTASPGRTTVAGGVIETIARLTTLSVPGVSRMGRIPATIIKGLFKRGQVDQGVVIEVTEDTVSADLYVVLEKDVRIQEVARKIQAEVARALSEMIGMRVGSINVYVEDIDYIKPE